MEMAAEEREVSCTGHTRMEEDPDHCIRKILDLTLEIIYLLTGEGYKITKKTCVEGLPYNYQHGTSPSSAPPPCLRKPEVKYKQKILEVTKKITELLTGEVPIRCQDVTVYFSMEEWEYLDGHKDLYKEVMMDNQLPLTSPDGSSNGNPPEKCPLLYSWNSTQEGHTIPHHHQLDGSSHGNPLERCPHPLYSQESTQEDHNYARFCQGEDLIYIKVEVKAEEEETYVRGQRSMEGAAMMMPIKQEESFHVMMDNQLPLTSPDGSSHGNPPERCPRPLYSRDSTQEGHTIPHQHQLEVLSVMKAEVKVEEETYVKGDQQSTEETGKMVKVEEGESSLDVNSADVQKGSARHLILSPEHTEDKCDAQYSLGINPNTQHRPMDRPSDLSNFEESSAESHHLPTHGQRVLTSQEVHSCSECEQFFTNKEELTRHQSLHTGRRPFLCSECGRCFPERGGRGAHSKLPAGTKPFCCPECGMCFTHERKLLKHLRYHTGERPFSCSECDKSFMLKEYLVRHQRTHTGERPFQCSECEKSFMTKPVLLKHQRLHTGERPYSCSECGKCCTQKDDLVRHQRSHTGERPYCCTMCGKRFKQGSHLRKHQRVHAQ